MAKYDISDEYDFNKDQTGVYLLLRANGRLTNETQSNIYMFAFLTINMNQVGYIFMIFNYIQSFKF